MSRTKKSQKKLNWRPPKKYRTHHSSSAGPSRDCRGPRGVELLELAVSIRPEFFDTETKTQLRLTCQRLRDVAENTLYSIYIHPSELWALARRPQWCAIAKTLVITHMLTIHQAERLASIKFSQLGILSLEDSSDHTGDAHDQLAENERAGTGQVLKTILQGHWPMLETFLAAEFNGFGDEYFTGQYFTGLQMPQLTRLDLEYSNLCMEAGPKLAYLLGVGCPQLKYLRYLASFTLSGLTALSSALPNLEELYVHVVFDLHRGEDEVHRDFMALSSAKWPNLHTLEINHSLSDTAVTLAGMDFVRSVRSLSLLVSQYFSQPIAEVEVGYSRLARALRGCNVQSLRLNGLAGLALGKLVQEVDFPSLKALILEGDGYLDSTVCALAQRFSQLESLELSMGLTTHFRIDNVYSLPWHNLDALKALETLRNLRHLHLSNVTLTVRTASAFAEQILPRLESLHLLEFAFGVTPIRHSNSCSITTHSHLRPLIFKEQSHFVRHGGDSNACADIGVFSLL